MSSILEQWTVMAQVAALNEMLLAGQGAIS